MPRHAFKRAEVLFFIARDINFHSAFSTVWERFLCFLGNLFKLAGFFKCDGFLRVVQRVGYDRLGFLVFMDQILAMVGADAATSGPARTYLTIVSFGGIFVVVSNCYSNIIRAEGQAGKAMMGQLIDNLLNVILDPIMILLFDWGIAGAAIATVICRQCSELTVLPGHSPWQMYFPWYLLRYCISSQCGK